MRTNLSLCAILLALLVFTGAAFAQSQNVQVTSGPEVRNLNANSVTITWSTNVPAGSVIKYGTDQNNLDQTAQTGWGGTNHSLELKNLKAGTKYYYQVQSNHGLGTGSGIMSPVKNFTTPGQAAAQSGTAQPTSSTAQPNGTNEANIKIIAGPIVQEVKEQGASQIWWQTDSPSSTILMYGTDPNNMSQKKEEAWGKDSHTVRLTGLQPGTTYYYQVVTSEGRSLEKGSFQAPNASVAQQKFQIIHGPVIEKLAPDSVVVAWTTNAPSSSTVMYGTDPNNLSQKAEAAWGQQTHRVTVRNLNPNTKYYFRVQTGQAQGTGEAVTSSVFPVMTAAAGQQARSFHTE
jgi:phosphodiesterase/alkaline phosphatase D-like protein